MILVWHPCPRQHAGLRPRVMLLRVKCPPLELVFIELGQHHVSEPKDSNCVELSCNVMMWHPLRLCLLNTGCAARRILLVSNLLVHSMLLIVYPFVYWSNCVPLIVCRVHVPRAACEHLMGCSLCLQSLQYLCEAIASLVRTKHRFLARLY
jgi:hypothetical protein